MVQIEIIIWSACAGIYLCYGCLASFFALYNRNWKLSATVVFVFSTGLTVVTLSGLLASFVTERPIGYRYFELGVGPVVGAIAMVGLRDFLRAQQRESVVDRGMLLAVVVLLCLLGLVVLPDPQAMEWIAVGVISCVIVGFWLTLRMWLLGDRYALPMAVACALLIFAMAGLYGKALGVLSHSLLTQAMSAVCASAYIVICCRTIKQRHSDHLHMQRALSMSRDRDLLTHTWTGVALIRKIEQAIARAHRNRREMAVICIEITNAAKLKQEHGANGLEQVIYGLSARIRSLSGPGIVVGRYSDTCFVVVQDGFKQRAQLRTIGLRLAAGARRPFVVNPYSVSSAEFRAEIGVGVARLSSDSAKTKRQQNTEIAAFDSYSSAQDALHEATELAIAAKQFNSRAAISDPMTHKAVALELVKL